MSNIGRVGTVRPTDTSATTDVASTPVAARTATHTLGSATLKGDATLQAIANGNGILERGARGDSVKKLQQGLIAAGVQVSGGADGVFGMGTANAVAAFQRQKGLAPSGKVDQGTLAALDKAIATGTTGTTGATGTTTTTGGTSTTTTTASSPGRARFESDPTLKKVLRGETTIGSGARGAHVQLVQKALEDVGYKLPVYGADGGYGAEASTAVKRFQRDMSLPQTGKVDKATLEKLASVAPRAGKTLERNPEYDQLFADGRLDMTIALGFDEGGAHESNLWKTQRGLQDQGFRKINPETMTAAQRTKLGLGADRYEKGAIYYHKVGTDPKTNKPVDMVTKLIHPGSASKPEDVAAMFKRSIEKDEVVTYNGHARYGTGPDFDTMESGKGNFIMDKTGGPTGQPHEPLTGAIAGKPDTMLKDTKSPGKYQLLYMNACTTDNYMPNMRDPAKFPGRNAQNTDIIGTTIASYIATGADNTLDFVKMLSGRKSVNWFTDEANKREANLTKEFIDRGVETDKNDADVKRAGALLFESGFADNSSNVR